MATGMRVEEVTTVTYGDGTSVNPWPVSWSAVWIGTLSAIALALILGLIGTAVGAHSAGHSFATWKDVGFWGLVWTVFAAFLSFVVGGWVATKVAGFRRSEPAMLHGAVVWLVAVPILLVLASMGAAAYLGSWYSGLAGTPAWVTPPPTAAQDRVVRGVPRQLVLEHVLELWLVGCLADQLHALEIREVPVQRDRRFRDLLEDAVVEGPADHRGELKRRARLTVQPIHPGHQQRLERIGNRDLVDVGVGPPPEPVVRAVA